MSGRRSAATGEAMADEPDSQTTAVPEPAAAPAPPQQPPPQPIERLFAVYQSLWVGHPQSAALALVIDLMAEQGFGAAHGFLVPDGSYLNEQTGELNGKINPGDRVWRRDKGWGRADALGNVAWPA